MRCLLPDRAVVIRLAETLSLGQAWCHFAADDAPLHSRHRRRGKVIASTRMAGKMDGAEWPRPRLRYYAGFAFAVSQILVARVSGIKKRPSTRHTAGTAIGYISALPRLPVEAYAAEVMNGTSPPPQPLP